MYIKIFFMYLLAQQMFIRVLTTSTMLDNGLQREKLSFYPQRIQSVVAKCYNNVSY